MEASALISLLLQGLELDDRAADDDAFERDLRGKRVRFVRSTMTLPTSASSDTAKRQREVIEGTIDGIDEQLSGVELRDVQEYTEELLLREFSDETVTEELPRKVLRESDRATVGAWEALEPVADTDEDDEGGNEANGDGDEDEEGLR